MRKSLLFFVIAILAASSQAFAQPPSEMGPPKAMLIIREEIKPGMMGSHARHSAEFVNVFNQLQTPNHRIALVPVAGNENEVLYLNAVKSFAELEGINKATDKKLSAANGSMKVRLDALDKEAPAMHAAMRDMFAVYRPDLSFNPGVNIAQMRYFVVTTTRIRPGYEGAYVEYVAKLISMAQKAKVDNFHVATYMVISGAPGGTLMTFRPLKSLAELDDPIGMRLRASMSEDQRKDADKAVRETIMSSETSTYAFAPAMSYVDRQFASLDPDFWSPKPQTAVKAKPRKRTPKPAAPPPAN